jgi:hypothetical protein
MLKKPASRAEMEAGDLLCSRNAQDRNVLVRRAQWKINQPPSLKRERVSLKGLHWLLAAALLGTRRVLARQGWAGETSGLFEHPAQFLLLSLI